MVANPFAIETAALRKTYDGVEAVRGLADGTVMTGEGPGGGLHGKTPPCA